MQRAKNDHSRRVCDLRHLIAEIGETGLLGGVVAPLLRDRLLDRSRVHLGLCADLLKFMRTI